MNIIVCRPRQKAQIMETPDCFEGEFFKALQSIIGGYIEVVRPNLFPEWALLLCDEDGKLKGLPANFAFAIGNKYDMICGTFIVCAEIENVDLEKDLAGMTEEQTETMVRLLDALAPMSKVGSPLFLKVESEEKSNV